MMVVRRRPNLRVLCHLCFPLFLVFRFFRCFTYPAANSGSSSSTTSAPCSMASDGTAKKLRKPYTITKTRDRWTNEEHERFLDALLLFGRDWKKIEDFVGTKTTIQIRSHAQKYFLKVQRIGLGAHVPPPHPKRKTAHSNLQNASSNGLQSKLYEEITLHRSPLESCSYHSLHSSCSDIVLLKESVACPSASSGLLPVYSSAWDAASSALNYASNEATSATDCHATVCGVEDDVGYKGKASICGASSNWTVNSGRSWVRPDCSYQMNPNPSHPVPNFTQVYSFLGNLFDPDIMYGMNVHLEKLEEMDSVSAKTVFILMRNLTANLCNPDFEHIRRWLSTYDLNTKTIGVISGTASFAK